MQRIAGAISWTLWLSCSGGEPAPQPRTATGTAVGEDAPGQAKLPGRWRRLRRPPDANLTGEQRRMVQRLESLGYVAGSTPATDRRGVIVHEPGLASPGLNFYTSGHAPEAVLMDMDGRILHRWSRAFADVWPDAEVGADNPNPLFWRRAHLFPGGEILAIHDGLGLVKLDRDSNVIWASNIQAHHDVQVLPDGDIWVLTREVSFLPDVHPGAPVLEDFLSVLDQDGREKRRLSLVEAFENSSGADWREISRRFWEKEKERKLAHPPSDLFHANALEVLDGRLASRVPEFRSGNVLLSLCHLDMVAVLDPAAQRIVWTLQAELGLQHDPTVTPDGQLLLFNNAWRPGRSSVQRFDPASKEVQWQYQGDVDAPFYSRTCGTARALPNGNILVTESDKGRAFEVSPDRRIVWEFLNPNRAGDHDEYVATLFEVERLRADFPVGWAAAAAGE